MYFRLMNRLDFEHIQNVLVDKIDSDKCRKIVFGRVKEILSTLDEHYGGARSCNDMGGFLFVITGEESCMQTYNEIIDYYQLRKGWEEYADKLCIDKKRVWMEEMYLRDSEDSIVIIYPTEKGV